jgi:inorganic pyrophosphatase
VQQWFAMYISNVSPLTNDLVQVVIETPKGSSFKYAYNSQFDALEIRHELPEGFFFPLNFGFIPATLADDGDPLDALVLGNQPLAPGCLIQCKILGALKAKQKSKGKKIIRNDRIIVAPKISKQYHDIHSLNDLSKSFVKQLEEFFTAYNFQRGIRFMPLRSVNNKQAVELIKKAFLSFRRANQTI